MGDIILQAIRFLASVDFARNSIIRFCFQARNGRHNSIQQQEQQQRVGRASGSFRQPLYGRNSYESSNAGDYNNQEVLIPC
jgi:hypothetical protein